LLNAANKKEITQIQFKLLILRYPKTGGPNHLIVLLNINGTMVGIDNGAIGGDDHIFNPNTTVDSNGNNLPPETIADILGGLSNKAN
jgi:hypothetical protein